MMPHKWLKKRRATIRRWIPQGLRDLFNRLGGYAIYYRGEYPDWRAADSAARGYDDDPLLALLKTAAIAVRDGDAAWEQDGVTWDHIPPDMPLFAAMGRVALARGRRLGVLDFGGGLGSIYFQCRGFLCDAQPLDWAVVEQAALVEIGQREIARDNLRFFASIDEAVRAVHPDVALLSSVLQYLERPWDVLERIIEAEIPYLVIDRHPCSLTRELITVQVVPPSLYAASYASWLFDCPRMMARLRKHYELITAWEGKDPAIRGWRMGAEFRGFLFKRYGEA